MNKRPSKKEIAECIGLWLAEGDNKSINEITFTNNSLYLIKYFHNTLFRLFKPSNIRVYSYSNSKNVEIPVRNVSFKKYIDKRATKPYYIWRFASIKLNKEWKQIVKNFLKDSYYQKYILRGFFAGEGSIKYSSHNSRQISISQKQRVSFIEKIFNRLKIKYKFEPYKRKGYIISNREDWDKLAKIKIADLHPQKKDKFWSIYQSYKQYHYDKGFLKKEVISLLNTQKTSKELAHIFNRTQYRIYDILKQLKDEGLIENYRIRSKDYWIKKEENKIIISKIKAKYIKLINLGYKKTSEIAQRSDKSPRSVQKRLYELERLGILYRDSNKEWLISNQNKEVLMI